MSESLDDRVSKDVEHTPDAEVKSTRPGNARVAYLVGALAAFAAGPSSATPADVAEFLRSRGEMEAPIIPGTAGTKELEERLRRLDDELRERAYGPDRRDAVEETQILAVVVLREVLEQSALAMDELIITDADRKVTFEMLFTKVAWADRVSLEDAIKDVDTAFDAAQRAYIEFATLGAEVLKQYQENPASLTFVALRDMYWGGKEVFENSVRAYREAFSRATKLIERK